MPNHQMLNNIQHKDLRILTKKSKDFGDEVGGALIFPAELTEAHKEYPIYIQKDPQTGEFQVVAIFGFGQDENLFLDAEGWSANYIPALIKREPFLIGLQKDQESDEKKPVVMIDMDSPRINHDGEGELVFLENGGNSLFLDEISKLLMLVHEGFQSSKNMLARFVELDLLEPFTLDIQFNNGVQHKSDAYYTINQEKLLTLDDQIIGELHRVGYLQYAYMILESLGNVRRLIEKRNSFDAVYP